MNSPIRWVVALFLIVTTAGCGSNEQESGKTQGTSTPETTMEALGRYTFGHEVRVFRPCDEETEYWVVDESGLLKQLYDGLAPSAGSPDGIFVFLDGSFGPAPVDGFGAEYAGQFTVAAVRYAALEGYGCHSAWGEFRYRAMGMEPSWMVELSGGKLRVTQFGEDDLVWEEFEESQADGVITFKAESGPGPALELVLNPEGGWDSMSGAYGGYTTKFTFGDDDFKGYAIRGLGQ